MLKYFELYYFVNDSNLGIITWLMTLKLEEDGRVESIGIITWLMTTTFEEDVRGLVGSIGILC